MRTATSLILFLFVALSCIAQTPSYRIEGYIEGLEGEITLAIEGDGEQTAEVTDGRFTFSGTLPYVLVATLQYNGERICVFFIDNKEYHITGNLPWPTVEGDEYDPRLQIYSEETQKIMERYAGKSDRQSILDMRREISEYASEAVAENMDNVLGPILYMEYLGRQDGPSDMLSFANNFPEHMQGHPYVDMIRQTAAGKEWKENGGTYIPVTIPDMSGKEIPLESLLNNGKLVLIDFWATWCPPCIEEIPHIKELWEHYSDTTLDVYAISLDRWRENWTGYLEKNKLPWTNVSYVYGPEMCPAARAYGVMSVPYKILLSPEGRVLAKNPSREELENLVRDHHDRFHTNKN